MIQEINHLIDDLEENNIYYKEDNQQIVLSNVKYDLVSILDCWIIGIQTESKNILNSNKIVQEKVILKNVWINNIKIMKIFQLIYMKISLVLILMKLSWVFLIYIN